MRHVKTTPWVSWLGLLFLLGLLMAGAALAASQADLVTDQVIMSPIQGRPYMVQEDYSLASLRQGLRSAARAALEGQGVAYGQVTVLPHLGLALAQLEPGQKGVLARLRGGGQVQWAEHPRPRRARALPSDPLLPYQWALRNIGDAEVAQDLTRRFRWPLALTSGADVGAEAAWAKTKGNPEDVVAVVDTGVYYLHGDLAPSMWTNPGEIPGNGRDDDGNGYVDDVHGYDFINADGDPLDDAGHGTMVSGMIAAAENNLGVVGLAPAVKIMAVKALDANGSGTDFGIAQALEYVLTMAWRGVPIRVVNLSLGGAGYSPALHRAIAALADFNILAVLAAGNSGDNVDYHLSNYPTNLPEAHTITAGLSDGQDQPVGWSCWGTYGVDIFAPGFNILAPAAPALHGANNFVQGSDQWTGNSGTSFAAPYTSAAVALAWALHPGADWSQIKALVLSSGQRLDSLGEKARTSARLSAAGLAAQDLPSGPMLFRWSQNLPAPGQVATLYGYGLGVTPGSVRINGVKLDVLGWQDSQAQVRLPGAEILEDARATLTLSTSDGRQASMPFLLAAPGPRQAVDMPAGQPEGLWPVEQKQVQVNDRVWGVVNLGTDANGDTIHGWGFFEPASSRLAYFGPLPSEMDQPTDMALVNHGGAVFCLGGSSANLVFRFDPDAGSWSRAGQAPFTDTLLEPLAASDGQYTYLAGGVTRTADGKQIWEKDVFRWDPSQNQWQRIATLPQSAERGKALVHDGRLILMGGYTTTNITWTQSNACLVLNLASGLWQQSQMPLTSLDGSLYVRDGWLYAHGAGNVEGPVSPFVIRASLAGNGPLTWQVLSRRMGFMDAHNRACWTWADSQGLGVLAGDYSSCPSETCNYMLRRFDLAWD